MGRTIPFIASAAFLVVCLSPVPLLADDPTLAIRLSGGGSADYAVADISKLTFEGDTLAVVTTSQTDDYELAAIVRMEFCWPHMAGVHGYDYIAEDAGTAYLGQNQPNPFSPATRIAFEIPRAGRVELKIYSVAGKLVRTLVSGERSAGSYNAGWDGCDDLGRPVTSGMYFCTLAAPGVSETRKMILVD